MDSARHLVHLLVLLMLTAGATQSKELPPMDRFSWIPTASAPVNYPMWIVEARLTTGVGDREMVPDRQIINNGWGEVGALRIEGEKLKPVPEQLQLTFYSFVEDQFYAGNFPLPTQRMRTLFGTGAPRPDGQSEPINRLILGVAPGGRVSVWLAGGQIATAVAHFVAPPANTPWSAVSSNPDRPRADFRHSLLASTLSPEILRQVTDTPPPVDLWDAASQAWTLHFAGDGRGAMLWLRGFNGERDWIDLENPTRRGESFATGLPLPAAMTIRWRGPRGPLRAEITFDADEVGAAFRRFGSTEGAGAPVLLIEPADTGTSVDLLLRRGHEIYGFTRAQVHVYGS